jgi:hypothetical protein
LKKPIEAITSKYKTVAGLTWIYKKVRGVVAARVRKPTNGRLRRRLDSARRMMHWMLAADNNARSPHPAGF